jgi:hypothetical protein
MDNGNQEATSKPLRNYQYFTDDLLEKERDEEAIERQSGFRIHPVSRESR